MKNILLITVALLFSLLVGCNAGNSSENTNEEKTDCSDIIELHKNNEAVFVNKQDIVLIESHGNGSAISFNTELKQVNGLSRGKTIVFDESQEEVRKFINCKK